MTKKINPSSLAVFQLSFIPFLAGIAIFIGCDQPADDQAAVSPQSAHPDSIVDTASNHLTAGSHYVDDQKCAECHAEIFATYQDVAMAKSFYDIDLAEPIEDFENNLFYHEFSDNHYKMEKEGDQLWLTRYKIRDDGSKHHVKRQQAQYVVGSGNHVRTYLTRNDIGEMYQLPVVWYSQSGKWEMAPGYDRPDHPDFNRPITRQCMFCHNAYPRFAPGSDGFGEPHRFPKDMPQGIGCQRCHGPGSKHVELSNSLDIENANDLKKVQDSIVNTGKMSSQLQDDVCFQCHMQPMSQRTSFIRNFGQSDYGYLPGQRLSEYMTYFEPDRDNELADHFEINHHPYRLRQSKCFTKTDGGIRCTDCHDPHRKISKIDQSNFYRRKCLTCHSGADCLDVENGRKADANCIACHMPERRTTDVVQVTMTDHKISRKPAANLTDPLNEIDVPIDMAIRPYPTSDKVKLEYAYRVYEYFARALDDDESSIELLSKSVAENETSATEPKLQLLQKLIEQRQFNAADNLLSTFEDKKPTSPTFKTNKALVSIGNGETEDAIKQLQSMLKTTPANPSAWYNLGIAFAKKDQSEDAIASWKKAIDLRPQYVKPRIKLGSLYALNGRYDEAAKQFQISIQNDTRNLEAYLKLSAVYRRTNNWHEATLLLRDALKIRPSENRILRELSLALLEIENKTLRNPVEAVVSARKLHALEPKLESALILALALSQTDRARESLQLVNNYIDTGKRKPEIGLIFAIAQLQLGSQESATKNYQGARNSLRPGMVDRLARVIRNNADRLFEKQNSTSNQK